MIFVMVVNAAVTQTSKNNDDSHNRFQVLYRLEKLLRPTPCGKKSEKLFKPIQNLKTGATSADHYWEQTT